MPSLRSCWPSSLTPRGQNSIWRASTRSNPTPPLCLASLWIPRPCPAVCPLRMTLLPWFQQELWCLRLSTYPLQDIVWSHMQTGMDFKHKSVQQFFLIRVSCLKVTSSCRYFKAFQSTAYMYAVFFISFS